MTSLIALLLCAVVPQASLSGPSKVMPGPLVLFDASASVSDSPIEWFVIGGPTPYVFKPQPNGTALFSSDLAGVYNVVVVARGQKDDKSPVTSSVAFVQVTVGTPAPPTPPTPTDPMTAAAVKYHDGLDAVYAAAYGAAAASAGQASPPTLASIYATLNSQAASGASAANASAFAQWQSQLPASGTEPTSAAQWSLVKSYFAALSSAFGSK
jgi:hypothetical protein